MQGIPTSVEDLRKVSPPELREMCKVIWALLDLCGSRPGEASEPGAIHAQGAFDRDELGIDPEDDYDLYDDE